MAGRNPRMSHAARRESVIEAAAAVFARDGYYGATVEHIADAAQISQPYVVRMFGGKEALFLEVLRASRAASLAAFRAALPGPPEGRMTRLGRAYRDLAGANSVHLLLMQSYLLGAHPLIGEEARTGFMEIVDFLRDEAALDAAQIETFLGRGMLTNVLFALQVDAVGDASPRAVLDRLLGARAGS